jgi:hypothetical protein
MTGKFDKIKVIVDILWQFTLLIIATDFAVIGWFGASYDKEPNLKLWLAAFAVLILTGTFVFCSFLLLKKLKVLNSQ